MISSPVTPRRLALLVLLPLLFLSGCTHLWVGNSNRHEAGSLVQFLYPKADSPIITPQIPTLHLPLRVGLAFVPSGTHGGSYALASNFSEAQKAMLLHTVAEEFRKLNFIAAIEIVPTTYLRPQGGFENLDQLKTIMGLDVIALIAYDQAQNSSDTALSLAYWTIVGAYVVPAQRNETHTLVEAVVYDIASRSLLFRAPGTSAIKDHSTPIRTDAELQADSATGFVAAAADMTKNLKIELDRFKVRAKESPDQIRVVDRPGYRLAGAWEGGFAALLVLAVLGRRWIRP